MLADRTKPHKARWFGTWIAALARLA